MADVALETGSGLPVGTHSERRVRSSVVYAGGKAGGAPTTSPAFGIRAREGKEGGTGDKWRRAKPVWSPDSEMAYLCLHAEDPGQLAKRGSRYFLHYIANKQNSNAFDSSNFSRALPTRGFFLADLPLKLHTSLFRQARWFCCVFRIKGE